MFLQIQLKLGIIIQNFYQDQFASKGNKVADILPISCTIKAQKTQEKPQNTHNFKTQTPISNNVSFRGKLK